MVITKPGYGIISECIANGTAMVYTSRGRFAEYHVLVARDAALPALRLISHDALLAGRWRAALEPRRRAAPPERPATDGAEVIADMIGAAVSSA